MKQERLAQRVRLVQRGETGSTGETGPMILTFNSSKTITLLINLNNGTDASGVKVDWGDGNQIAYTIGQDISGTIVGTLIVKIYGNFTVFGTGGPALNNVRPRAIGTWDGGALVSVNSWGLNTMLEVLSASFYLCTALVSVPATLPSTVRSMPDLFNGCTSFDQSLSGWDVSNVTSMIGMFKNSSSLYSNNLFKYDLTGWNINNVTSYSYFFSPDGSTDTTTTDPKSPFMS